MAIPGFEGTDRPMFSVPSLSIGDVEVVVHPVTSSEHLAETLDAVARIKGVDRVSIDRLSGTRAHLLVHASQPVALASELRALLRPRVSGCSVAGGRISVVLGGAPAPHAAADPDVAPGPRQHGDDEAPPGEHGYAAAVAAIDGKDEISVFLFDREQRLTAAVGGLHRRLGHEFAPMQGRRAEEVVRPEAWGLLGPGFRDALAGRERTVDVPVELVILEATFCPLMHDGEVVGGMVATRDVTAQRATERAFDDSSAALDALIDGSDTAFGLLAPGGEWARANDATCDLLGYDQAALRRSSILDLADDEPVALQHALRGIGDDAARDRYVGTLRMRHATGRSVEVAVRLSAVRAQGTLRGAVVELRAIGEDAVAGPPFS